MKTQADKAALFARDPDVLEIGIGEIVVGEAPKRLMTPALGSCVGVALYDQSAARGALAHIMLPTRPAGQSTEHPGRFAANAIPAMVMLLEQEGSPARCLVAKIAGGASMFRGDGAQVAIGQRNVAEVVRQLELMSIPLMAEDTGETHARTIELALDTGELLVRSYQFGVKRL